MAMLPPPVNSFFEARTEFFPQTPVARPKVLHGAITGKFQAETI